MRGRGRFGLGAMVVALSLCVLCAGSARAQESPADIATARELFREGLELSKHEKWEEARRKLAQSLALKKAALTYYTLAVADKRSGHLVAALEHFRGFLAQPVTDKTQDFVGPAEDALAELEKRVARVTVVVHPAGLTDLRVRIDGDELPKSAVGRKRLVDPGEHVVTAKAAGYRAQSKKLVSVEGGHQELVITLQPAPIDEEPAPEAEFPVLPVILLGAGAVVAGVGFGLGFHGVQKAKKVVDPDSPAADKALRFTVAGDVLMGVGGATAGVGLVLLIVHFMDGDAPPAAPTAIRPWLSDRGAGLQLAF